MKPAARARPAVRWRMMVNLFGLSFPPSFRASVFKNFSAARAMGMVNRYSKRPSRIGGWRIAASIAIR